MHLFKVFFIKIECKYEYKFVYTVFSLLVYLDCYKLYNWQDSGLKIQFDQV